ncbi:hypothetical protein J3R30DRAFT_3739351 [Lentinula aciculospora]|uniref:Fungal-type protein kinase domain-containing protein n=1 Tax=Lentinula aciculospora TaxID=153920 RepID=A0A9W8ZWZ8_9AGAR|nr:hypothetical protein J3R30DRAFT_3739351 [Lentinula aciculospora]
MATAHESVVFQEYTIIFDVMVLEAGRINNTNQQTFGLVVNARGPMGLTKLYTKLQEKQQTGLEKTKTETLEKQGAIGKLKNDRHLAYVLANPHQYKLHNGQDANDAHAAITDFGKLVYDMQQILTLDPYRHFTFGTTIENCTIRHWFLSHATLTRIATFDFIQLVRVFLSLAFSSLSGMGWDTAITFSYSDANRRQYNIEVNVDVLSDSVADSRLGRATRVWKVRDSNGKIRVLNDV